ncbi:hypothetical protein J4Q44_G00039070 [Coregonus suidteri]|uniref:Uncharacterized protein n=1 Tax=Coregonus suidteri TaxID=861788 RepID=A0AAN8MID7_9TELE
MLNTSCNDYGSMVKEREVWNCPSGRVLAALLFESQIAPLLSIFDGVVLDIHVKF